MQRIGKQQPKHKIGSFHELVNGNYGEKIGDIWNVKTIFFICDTPALMVAPPLIAVHEHVHNAWSCLQVVAICYVIWGNLSFQWLLCNMKHRKPGKSAVLKRV